MATLGDEEIERALAGLEGWRLEGSAISKAYDRGDFAGSLAFVNALAGPAEEINHHPDLEISWDTVTVSLSSHSEGGLTAADFELAARIDGLA